MTYPCELRWASESSAHTMAHPDELVYMGWDYVIRDGERVRDPRYPSSMLMWRPCK